MAKFREFYVPVGAGSNFLAGKCLWAEEAKSFWGNDKIEIHDADSSVNEFFYLRAKTPAEWKHNAQPKGLAISSPEKIKTVLTELHLWTNKNYNQLNFEFENRERVIRNIDNLWTEDSSYWTFDFFAFMDFEKSKWKDKEYPTEVINMIHQAQDCFATSREYYFKRCQEKNWDTFLITHSHPFLGISPRIKLPENFKTLAMELNHSLSSEFRFETVEGGMFLWLKTPGHNPIKLAQAALNNGVAIVPGSAFGTADHARLSFATSMEVLEDALGRLKKGIEG